MHNWLILMACHRGILCSEVKESHSLHSHIYIFFFVQLFLKRLFFVALCIFYLRKVFSKGWRSKQAENSQKVIFLFVLSLLFFYIYIYKYSVIHKQTVSFYQNSSVWLDTQDARSRDQNPSNFTLDCVSDYSATKRTMSAKGILRYF